MANNIGLMGSIAGNKEILEFSVPSEDLLTLICHYHSPNINDDLSENIIIGWGVMQNVKQRQNSDSMYYPLL